MSLMHNSWELFVYKLRAIGLRNMARVAYLDISESALHHIAKRFSFFAVSPHSIQIECTPRCNLKCTFCELSYWTEKPADLTLDTIQRIVEHLPKLKRVD